VEPAPNGQPSEEEADRERDRHQGALVEGQMVKWLIRTMFNVPHILPYFSINLKTFFKKFNIFFLNY
jgi:hypothetical protein